MRILEVISASANRAVRGNVTWRRNLYEPLVEAGHDVVLVPAEDGEAAMASGDAAARARFSETVLRSFRREHRKRPFALLFAYVKDGMIDPGVIDEIRDAGVTTCNFSCNNVHQFDLVDAISPHFDVSLHAERDVGERFKAVGATPLWWPMASNPRYFHPVDVRRDVQVSFAGASYGLRAAYVARILDAGVAAEVFGPGWQVAGVRRRAKRRAKLCLLRAAGVAYGGRRGRRYRALAQQVADGLDVAVRYPDRLHAPLSDDDLVALYSRSEISLGFLDVYDAHDPSLSVVRHVHLREFEAPMCGACYCTQYSDELADAFVPDVEMIMWDNAAEMLEKLDFYLRHPAAAEAVRAAGHRRALECHTYSRRFASLFEELGLE